MHTARRVVPVTTLIALLVTACGGGGTALEPLAGVPDDRVLSTCEPASPGETVTVVEATGERPSVEAMEVALADNPDAMFVLDDLEAGGTSREAALHDVYAQVVGERLVADASQLPGYVSAAYARPDVGEPFELAFSGELPEQFDPTAYELASYGLEVTTGAAGFDPDAMSAAFAAAEQLGIRTVSGSGDEVTGTATIEVISATPQQVTEWEALLDDPDRICLVLALTTSDCDGAVEAAQERAERQDELFPAAEDGTTDDAVSPPAPRIEEVRRSYLGLTVAAAQAKADDEERRIRVVNEDGVGLATTDDLDPTRLNLTVCDDVVVDARFDIEP